MTIQPLCVMRRAHLGDLETLVGFGSAMAMETEGRQLDKALLRKGISGILTSPDKGFYLVAENTVTTPNQIIGQLMITCEWSDWRSGQFWWLQSVYVDRLWRRQGIYRCMHEYVMAQARDREDVCGVRLYVEGDNDIAQLVYQRVGLRHTPYHIYELDFVLPRKPSDG